MNFRYVTEIFPAQKKGMLSCLRRQIQGQVFSVIKLNVLCEFLGRFRKTEYRQSFYARGTLFENEGCVCHWKSPLRQWLDERLQQ
jgi:hypothetical protein